MAAMHPPEAINWAMVIDRSEDLPELEGSVREQGCQFHSWLKQCFETAAIDFERDVEWLNRKLEWNRGRYDCCDGHYIYEFKTVSGLPESPRRKDVQQVQRYLKGLDLQHGVVVYIDREGFEVDQHMISQNS